MIKDILKELCALNGVSGNEGAVRDYIAARVKPYAAEMTTDAMGNLLVFVKGQRAPKQKVMLAAHMDEVGIIITGITEEGYLKFDFAGGVDRRVVIGKRVSVGDKAIPGVIALKAVHLVEGGERKKVPTTKSLHVDIGCRTREEAEKLVSLGDTGAFDDHIVEFGEGFLRAKAIDDRVGCAVMIALIEAGVPVDCHFAFTVQEEVGCRGSAAAAFRIQPEIGLVLEGTTAADLPSQTGSERVCAPGKGPVLPFMDGGSIYDRQLWRELTALAEAKGIPWQTKTWISGGTDASSIQKTACGARVAAISAAVRYIHSPSCVGKTEDFENMLRLAKAYLETL